MSEYTDTVRTQNILALRALLKQMPPFCTDYFRGIASSTSPRTQTGYCRDIYTFLQFVVMRNPIYRDSEIKVRIFTHKIILYSLSPNYCVKSAFHAIIG